MLTTKVVVCFYGCSPNEINAFGDSTDRAENTYANPNRKSVFFFIINITITIIVKFYFRYAVTEIGKEKITNNIMFNETDIAAGDTASVSKEAEEKQLSVALVNDVTAVNVVGADAGDGVVENEKQEDLSLASVNDTGDKVDPPLAAAAVKDAATENVVATAAAVVEAEEEGSVNEANNVIVAVIPLTPPIIKCKRITERRVPVDDGEPIIFFMKPKRIQERRRRVEERDQSIEFNRRPVMFVAEVRPIVQQNRQATPKVSAAMSVEKVNKPKKVIENKKQQNVKKISAVTTNTEVVQKKRKSTGKKQQIVQEKIPTVEQAATETISLASVDVVKRRNRIAKKRPSVQQEIPDVIQAAVASLASGGDVIKNRKRFAKKRPIVSDSDQTAAPSLACVEVVKKRKRFAIKRQINAVSVVEVKKISKRFNSRKWSRAQVISVDQEGSGKKRRCLKEISTTVEVKRYKRTQSTNEPWLNDKIQQPTSIKRKYLTTAKYRNSILIFAGFTKRVPTRRTRANAKPTELKYNFSAQTNHIFTSNNLRTTTHETINHNGRILKAKPYAQIPMNNNFNEMQSSMELTIFPEPENEIFSYLNIQTNNPKLQCEQQLIKLHDKVKEWLNGYLMYPEQYINLLTVYKNLQLTPLILKKNPHCLEMIYKLRNYCGNIEHWRYNNFEDQPNNHMEFRAQIYCTLSLTNEIYQLFKSLFNYPKTVRFWDAFKADVEKFRKNIRNLSASELKNLDEEPPDIDDDNDNHLCNDY